LAEALREELEEIINYELDDPRVEGVGISEVLLSRDGRRATIHCVLPGESGGEQDGIQALDRAKNYIREIAMGRLALYRMPDLRFELDPAQRIQERAGHLLRRVRKGRPRTRTPDSDFSQENLRK